MDRLGGELGQVERLLGARRLFVAVQQLGEALDAFFLQDRTELSVGSVSLGKIGTIFLPKGADQGIAALPPNFAVVVAHASVEALWKVLGHLAVLTEKRMGKCSTNVLYLQVSSRSSSYVAEGADQPECPEPVNTSQARGTEAGVTRGTAAQGWLGGYVLATRLAMPGIGA